jgi:FlaA1/EpsC-like NDP-sugar epimerase
VTTTTRALDQDGTLTMDIRLQDKTVLVTGATGATGATTNIGSAIGSGFAAEAETL